MVCHRLLVVARRCDRQTRSGHQLNRVGTYRRSRGRLGDPGKAMSDRPLVVSGKPESSSQNGSSISSRLRVVVVDAEPDTVMSLLVSLRDRGYDAVGYASGKVALEGIQKLDPDVIISDITMPNPNGWDIARQVRKLKGNAERPLLIATSAQCPKGAERLLAHTAGFNFYVTKPCDPRVLMALIEGARPK